ncbi:MAG: hypothetical protein QNJ70_23970 [Xenococcaceae cyanobacterium MO_207.B15]|nr:hypothetical protein [Xenococcaceae cyanobacterium MO_207.B15]
MTFYLKYKQKNLAVKRSPLTLYYYLKSNCKTNICTFDLAVKRSPSLPHQSDRYISLILPIEVLM